MTTPDPAAELVHSLDEHPRIQADAILNHTHRHRANTQQNDLLKNDLLTFNIAPFTL